jgi:hypothetical protein
MTDTDGPMWRCKRLLDLATSKESAFEMIAPVRTGPLWEARKTL